MRVKKSINVTGLLARDDGWSLWCRHFLFLWVQSSGWKSVSVFSNQGRTMGQRKKEFPWPDAPHTPLHLRLGPDRSDTTDLSGWLTQWKRYLGALSAVSAASIWTPTSFFCKKSAYYLVQIRKYSTSRPCIIKICSILSTLLFILGFPLLLAIYGLPLPQCLMDAILHSCIY